MKKIKFYNCPICGELIPKPSYPNHIKNCVNAEKKKNAEKAEQNKRNKS